jgi:protein tyrosine phosphatase
LATKYIRNEFKTIIELTDQDDVHKSILNVIPENLCRYKKIFPYKDNTVSILTEHKAINASWVHIPTEKSFIMCQAPLDNTIDDFCQMCFQYNVNMIIMLCNIQEDNKEKSAIYWDPKKVTQFKITNIKITENNDVFMKQNIEIINLNGNCTKIISHLLFKRWPDHLTPDIQNVVYTFEHIS